MTWQDADFGHRVIKIRCDNDFITKGRRDRVVPINEFLYAVLKDAPRHIQAPQILFTREGKPLIPESVRQRFTRTVKRSKLRHFSPHHLRHTFGTWLAADGVDLVTIKNLLGHQDIKTTMKYLHAAPNRMEWAVENLHLVGQTQTEVDQLQNVKIHGTGQDLVTGTQSKKVVSA